MMLALVDNHLEEPLFWPLNRRGGCGVDDIRCAAAVTDMLQITVGRSTRIGSVALAGKRVHNAHGVFCFLVVDDEIAFFLVDLADQPAENVLGVGRIDDAAAVDLAVPGSFRTSERTTLFLLVNTLKQYQYD